MCAVTKTALSLACNRQHQQAEPHLRDNNSQYVIGIGPATVSEQVWAVAYRLDLEGKVLSACHNVFSVTRLHYYWSDGPVQPLITNMHPTLHRACTEHLSLKVNHIRS